MPRGKGMKIGGGRKVGVVERKREREKEKFDTQTIGRESLNSGRVPVLYSMKFFKSIRSLPHRPSFISSHTPSR